MRWVRIRIGLCSWITMATLAGFSLTSRADEIVLRNLKKLSNVTVDKLDEDGVVLSSGQVLGLDAILSATLKQQDEFDALHRRLAEDLFRIRLRVQNGDFENLQPHLDKVYPVYKGRQSKTAALVHLARLRESVLLGKWGRAVLAHFKLFTLAQQGQQPFLQALGYRFEATTGVSGLICPFGFSQQELVDDWDSILAAYQELPTKHPSGLDFYFFALRSVADIEVKPEIASKKLQLSSLETFLLESLPAATNEKIDSGEVEAARVKLDGYTFQPADSQAQRALYYFVYGMLEIRSERADRNEGLLSLLRVHAEYGDSVPAISAAALTEVHGILQRIEPKKNAKSVADELFSRYPSSIFAKQLRMKGDRVK